MFNSERPKMGPFYAMLLLGGKLNVTKCNVFAFSKTMPTFGTLIAGAKEGGPSATYLHLF